MVHCEQQHIVDRMATQNMISFLGGIDDGIRGLTGYRIYRCDIVSMGLLNLIKELIHT